MGRSPHSDARHHAVLAVGDARHYGDAVPYGIGAAVAYPGRQVVSIVGDGGFTMLMGEVATLVKYGCR
jgi:pyruvate dehydrogenase (quinone)